MFWSIEARAGWEIDLFSRGVLQHDFFDKERKMAIIEKTVLFDFERQ